MQDRFEELQKVSRGREEEQKAKYKHQFDLKARTRSFQPGDLVLLRTPPKGQSLHAEWDGPYSVMRRCDATTYELHMPDHPRRKVKRHINLLRPFNSPALGCLNATEILEREMPDCFEEKEGETLPDTEAANLEQGERVKLQQLMKNYRARFKNKPGCAVGQ